jgi:hypothetical protein
MIRGLSTKSAGELPAGSAGQPRWRRRLPQRAATIAWACGWALNGVAGSTYQEAVAANRTLAAIADSVVAREQIADTGRPEREEYLVIFRFEGLLWKYSPASGTRVCGTAPGAWPPPPALVLERVRHVEPWVAAISIYRAASMPVAAPAILPNACVPGCLAQIGRLLVNLGMPDEAGLVLFSYDPGRPEQVLPPDAIGHCVLVYRYGDQWTCLDPRRQQSPQPLRQVNIGVHLDPTLRVLAERSDYELKRARLLLISRATLRQISADLTWRLWADRALRATDDRDIYWPGGPWQ